MILKLAFFIDMISWNFLGIRGSLIRFRIKKVSANLTHLRTQHVKFSPDENQFTSRSTSLPLSFLNILRIKCKKQLESLSLHWFFKPFVNFSQVLINLIPRFFLKSPNPPPPPPPHCDFLTFSQLFGFHRKISTPFLKRNYRIFSSFAFTCIST